MKRTKTTHSIFEIIADSSLTGAPRHLLTLLSGVNRHKFVVSVICPPGPLVAEVKKLKFPVFQVPMSGKADINAINAVARILKKYDPDIVHTHGQRAGLVGRMAAKNLPIKKIHTEHTYTREFRLNNPLLHWSHLRGMKGLDRWTDQIIAVSNAVKKFMLDAGLTKPNKIVMIYNGISPNAARVAEADIEKFRDQFGLKKTDIVIGTVGSFNHAKDTATLIHAFSRIAAKWSQSKLILIGSGPLKRDLTNLAQRLKLEDKIIFAGNVEDIFPAMKTFNVFVLPSLSEAFGITLLEAMQAGAPIIATRVGGIPEIITNKLNGILVEPKQPKKLAAAILNLINDKRLQRKLVGNYPATLKRFSADVMVKQTESVYSSLFH
ncbi:MAG: glycosyltransferase [Patescibacteria group bacterium]